MSKSLLDAFEIERTKNNEEIIKDYDVFSDKNLLEKLRTKIIENIIDKEIPEGINIKDFINNEIDKSIEGYDLTNLERSHIYNMIEDEMNGNGPLGELLKDKDITEIMVNGPHEVYIEIFEKLRDLISKSTTVAASR